jgi:hypothetical protein
MLKPKDEDEEQDRADRLVRLHDLMLRSDGDQPDLVYVPIKEERSEDSLLPVILAA